MQYTNYEYMPLTSDIFADCIATAESWVEQHHEEGIEDELEAIKLLFTHWDELGLVGGAIKLFGRIEAFTIGEYLNDRMALIYIEKQIRLSAVCTRLSTMNSFVMNLPIRNL